MLKLSVTEPKEKEELQHLCSRDGESDYQAYTAESYTYAELMEQLSRATVSVGHHLDYVPDIEPRLYSEYLGELAAARARAGAAAGARGPQGRRPLRERDPW